MTGPIAAECPEPSSDQQRALDPLSIIAALHGEYTCPICQTRTHALDECATAEILEQVKQELSTIGRPDIEYAKLPMVYNDAVIALRLCERIDECMSWANKSQALASYAKQAKDNQLRAMATRIQARAISLLR